MVILVITLIHFQDVVFKITFTLTLLEKWPGVHRIVHLPVVLLKPTQRKGTIKSYAVTCDIETIKERYGRKEISSIFNILKSVCDMIGYLKPDHRVGIINLCFAHVFCVARIYFTYHPV
jgi:hypothetical protein